MSTQLSDKDVTAIKAFLESWDRFVMEADWERFSGLLTDDVVLMPPDQPIVEGKKAAISLLGEFPPVKETCLTPVRIEGRDDFACVTCTFTLTMEPEPGKAVSMKGKGSLSFRKQPDGSWLCASDTWNLDGPPAEA